MGEEEVAQELLLSHKTNSAGVWIVAYFFLKHECVQISAHADTGRAVFEIRAGGP